MIPKSLSMDACVCFEKVKRRKRNAESFYFFGMSLFCFMYPFSWWFWESMNLFLIKKTYRLRNVDGYQNMSRKQLENIFTTPSAPISTSNPVSRPRPRSRSRTEIRTPLTPRSTPRQTPKPLLIDADGLEKMKMTKTRPVPQNKWHQWYNCLINHFVESMNYS